MALFHCEWFSQAVRMPTSATVILPHDITKSSEPAQVLYLLHGKSHNHASWHRYTSLEQYCQDYPVAVIMPEVNRSFYTDMKYGVDYYTYLTEELPRLCGSMFNISTAPEDSYIAGMSMGGYGALKAALGCPDRYRACAAISAVTNIYRKIDSTPDSDPKKEELRGIFGEDLKVSEKDDLQALALKAQKNGVVPELYLACGSQDHLYPDSAEFDQFLTKHGISHTFEEWPGIHDWPFWDTAIHKVLRSFFG